VRRQESADGIAASPLVVYRQDAGAPAPPQEDAALKKRLDDITAKYRAMIAAATKDGYLVAADNLQRFLNGTGGKKTIDEGWLRGFGAVTSAERTNQERFEDGLEDFAGDTLRNGTTTGFFDHWDRKLTASVLTELYYASGTSTISSRGHFTLSRNSDVTTIEGTVTHRWWDPYDWHAGLSALVPGFGTISDEDALLLQKHRGAKPFTMESVWTQTVTGTVEHGYVWDSSEFTWSGP
jgi:hypothetical protein